MAPRQPTAPDITPNVSTITRPALQRPRTVGDVPRRIPCFIPPLLNCVAITRTLSGHSVMGPGRWPSSPPLGEPELCRPRGVSIRHVGLSSETTTRPPHSGRPPGGAPRPPPGDRLGSSPRSLPSGKPAGGSEAPSGAASTPHPSLPHKGTEAWITLSKHPSSPPIRVGGPDVGPSRASLPRSALQGLDGILSIVFLTSPFLVVDVLPD